MTQRIDSLKKRAREMYLCKWIFVDVDSTPKKKMEQMYELCRMMKDGSDMQINMINFMTDHIL